MKLKLAIVGSRHFTNYLMFRAEVDEFVIDHGILKEIISGGAKGVDRMAQQYAEERAYPFKVFEAEWDLYGKAAGPIRNEKIVARADHILAFLAKESKGTANTITQAETAGVPVTVIKISKRTGIWLVDPEDLDAFVRPNSGKP